MSLDSLERTVDARLGRITLISNASCPEIERLLLDRPPDLQGYWRLCTTRHYAFHMGNVPTPWMHEVAKETASPPAPPLPLPPLRKPLVGRLPYPIRRKLARVVHWTLSRQLAAA